MRYNNRMIEIGFVYKITPHNCEEFYIGSTTDMKQRESQHITVSKIKTTKVYIKIRECGGFVMKLLYEYECENETELRMEEQRCIDIMKPILNINRAFTSEEGHIEQRKIYNEKNKDVLREKQKIYAEKNKDAIREKQKIYNEKNREVLSEKHKIYNQKNKDAISGKKKQYAEKNRDVIRERKKIYNEKNRDWIREKRQKNKDVVNAKQREKTKLKKQQQQQV